MVDRWARNWGVVGAGSILLAMAGCAAPAPKPVVAAAPPPTVSADDYSAVKAAYLAANPNARVGRVEAVLPDQQRVAVGDVTVGDFNKGDILSIVDAKMNVLADGTVVDKDSDLLYVKYSPVAGSAAPVAGDLAIRAQLQPSK